MNGTDTVQLPDDATPLTEDCCERLLEMGRTANDYYDNITAEDMVVALRYVADRIDEGGINVFLEQRHHPEKELPQMEGAHEVTEDGVRRTDRARFKADILFVGGQFHSRDITDSEFVTALEAVADALEDEGVAVLDDA